MPRQHSCRVDGLAANSVADPLRRPMRSFHYQFDSWTRSLIWVPRSWEQQLSRGKRASSQKRMWHGGVLQDRKLYCRTQISYVDDTDFGFYVRLHT
jgi:hypothetical protein